jgi:hypothetical protein
VPPENRFRRDQRRDLREHSTSQALAEDGKTPSLVVTQLQASTVQSSLKNPVLLGQKFDHVPLCCRSINPKCAATKSCNGITAPVYVTTLSIQF